MVQVKNAIVTINEENRRARAQIGYSFHTEGPRSLWVDIPAPLDEDGCPLTNEELKTKRFDLTGNIHMDYFDESQGKFVSYKDRIGKKGFAFPTRMILSEIAESESVGKGLPTWKFDKAITFTREDGKEIVKYAEHRDLTGKSSGFWVPFQGNPEEGIVPVLHARGIGFFKPAKVEVEA